MSSGFITESEVLEARRRRQEEWDKVRTEDQPKEVPEEQYDIRPLYQRLEEQRMKKDAEYEEAHKLKNMIRGLDDDEVGFLDLVEETKAKAAQQISIEEQREIREYRERVSNLAESEEMIRLRAQLAPTRTSQTASQTQKNILLQGLVVRKRKISEIEEKKQENGEPAAKINGIVNNSSDSNAESDAVSKHDKGALRCIGVLPGLGNYDTDSTSDSENSSNSEEETCSKLDLLGRPPQELTEAKKRAEEGS